MTDASKQALRKVMRKKRGQLTEEQQYTAAKQLVLHLTHSQNYQNAQHIACYLANDAEINPELIIHSIWEHKDKICYLPVLHKHEEKSLGFMPYHQNDALITNRYGIPEPHFSENILYSSKKMDLILMPLVAFDKQGHRLGMGAGYYDRTLAYRQQNVAIRKPLLIGLAYQLQEVDAVPIDPWDIPLDGIATENGLSLYF